MHLSVFRGLGWSPVEVEVVAVLGNALTTPIPPFVMLGRKSPYLYAEHDVEQARRHLSMDFLLSRLNDQPSADVYLGDVEDYDYFDGQFRPLLAVYRGPVITFELAEASPQPRRLRDALRATLDLTRQALDEHEKAAAQAAPEQADPEGGPEGGPAGAAEPEGAAEGMVGVEPAVVLTTAEIAELRRAIDEVNPAAPDLAAELAKLADRFGASQPPSVTGLRLLDSGSLLHNLAHKIGIAHP
jgi:hypothetical protein